MIKLKSKKTRMGIMLFLVPALVIYLVFQIIPIIGPSIFLWLTGTELQDLRRNL